MTVTIKITLTKKSRADETQGILTTIQFRLLHLPISYL